MKTSVIITNYNQGRFAATALDSIYKQTALPSEIIVVDDCSTDNSVSLIRETMKRFDKSKIPIQLITRSVNGKPAGCRNTGIKALSPECEAVAFLDIDDFYDPRKIEASVEILEKFPLVGLVYTDYRIYNVTKNSILPEFKHPFDFNLLWQTCIVSTNSVVRRSTLDKVGLFDEQYYGVEDYQMWLRIALVALPYHIPEQLFTYRIHGANLSENHGQYMQDQIPNLKQELMSGNYQPPR